MSRKSLVSQSEFSVVEQVSMKPEVFSVRPVWRYAYDGLEEEMSALSSIDASPSEENPCKTVQDGKDDADINVVMKRFGHGVPLPQPRGDAQYGDFTGVSDYQTALNELIRAQEVFDALPAVVREEFDNDPAELYKAVHDESQRDRLLELGLLERPPAPQEPMAVRVVPDPKPEGNPAS